MNEIANKQTKVIDLGLINYQEAWDYQTGLFNEILAIKKSGDLPTPNYLLFCEHRHVYTLGKTGDKKNLLVNEDQLKKIDASYYQTNRGGDITYHGPGQLVVYPVLDLENFFTDIHRYMRSLEEAVIQTLETFNIQAGRLQGITGVWIDPLNAQKARKICALGVKTSRWVTLHGLALNVNTNLDYFNNIIPCAIDDKAVTSMQKELAKAQDIKKVGDVLLEKLYSVFEMENTKDEEGH
ncbi:MAG: lipoyl(octanoyl) transferase LipB [Flammeovirgaceae bacterium]|nr:lipoyl(octanoyl) transferase LipB [Flammeovirgaceae bacterium]